MRQEEREPLADIAVAVIDRSQSQEYGNRIGQADAAEKALKESCRPTGQHRIARRDRALRHHRRRGRHAALRKPRPGACRRAA